jgi:hypothetical protein
MRATLPVSFMHDSLSGISRSRKTAYRAV